MSQPPSHQARHPLRANLTPGLTLGLRLPPDDGPRLADYARQVLGVYCASFVAACVFLA